MTRIAILTCHNTLGSVCTGAGCLSALNSRTGTFSAYQGKEVELAAFFQCNGCERDCTDPGLVEKLTRIASLHPDAIHVGVCTKSQDGSRCPTIQEMVRQLELLGIPCVDGTHR